MMTRTMMTMRMIVARGRTHWNSSSVERLRLHSGEAILTLRIFLLRSVLHGDTERIRTSEETRSTRRAPANKPAARERKPLAGKTPVRSPASPSTIKPPRAKPAAPSPGQDGETGKTCRQACSRPRRAAARKTSPRRQAPLRTGARRSGFPR